MKRFLAVFLLFSLVTLKSCSTTGWEDSQDIVTPAQGQNGPTMGWSTWNTFGLNINEDIIKSQANALVELGLSDVGYKYVNIDDGFWDGREDNGQLKLNTELFPNGMRALTDYIHGLNLKAGIYSDAGDNTCASNNVHPWGLGVGLYGHEEEDCELYFGDWNFDFIKVDYCGGYRLQLDEKEQFTKISNAIAKVSKKYNKDIHLNVCRWAYPGTWISEVAGSWRTTGDIYDAWVSVKKIIGENLYMSAYSSLGHYNDMDMLEVGRSMTEEEDKTHFAMWCMMNSPLLIGCDLRTIDEKTLKLLKNKDLIGINQDIVGQQAHVLQHFGETYILVKDLEKQNGVKRAVAFYNPSDIEQEMFVSYADLELSGQIHVKDVFDKNDYREIDGGIVITVPAHGTRVYIVKGEKRLERYLYEAECAFLSGYQRIKAPDCGQYTISENASGGMIVSNLGNKDNNDIIWNDVYSTEGGNYKLLVSFYGGEKCSMGVEINSKFVDTLKAENYNGDIGFGLLDIQLQRGKNVIRFYNSQSSMPNIDYIELNNDSVISSKLESAKFKLLALLSYDCLTKAIKQKISQLFSELQRTNLQTEDREILIEKANGLVQDVLSAKEILRDYWRWDDMAVQVIEMSSPSYPLNQLKHEMSSIHNQLDNADSVPLIVDAINYLKTALKEYLCSDDSLPIDGKELDMTALIDNYDFSNNTGWGGDLYYNYGCAEVFNNRFDIFQSLSEMKPGYYTVSCNALYRKSYNDFGSPEDNDTTHVLLYINENEVPVHSIFNGEWPDIDRVTPDNICGYPRMYIAEKKFSEGYFKNTLTVKCLKKGDIRFGLKIYEFNYGNWCCFDNFKLTYRPLDNSTNINQATSQPVAYSRAIQYDLSGKRISNTSNKQVHVVGGRKFLK